MTRPFPLHTGIATVAAIRALTPSMTRFTLQADAFAEPGIEQPGEILTLGWAPDGEELVLPQLGWRFPDGKPEQHWRNFTVRRFDPARGDDRRRLLRPRRHRARLGVGAARGGRRPRRLRGPAHALGARPGRPTWVLLAADETGLPALLAILETLPAGLPAFAFAEVDDEDERQAVAGAADVDLRWVSRERPARRHDVGADRGAARSSRLPPGRGRRAGAAARRSRCATCAATSRPSARRRR